MSELSKVVTNKIKAALGFSYINQTQVQMWHPCFSYTVVQRKGFLHSREHKKTRRKLDDIVTKQQKCYSQCFIAQELPNCAF